MAIGRGARELLVGVAAGAVAWVYFAVRPDMPAMVGTTRIADLVPAHYQASAFPAFAASLAAALADRVDAPVRARRRLALLGLAGAIAFARLGGQLPLSGHAVFLCASACFDMRAGADDGRATRLVLALSGLAVTAAYKLLVWHDIAWLAASILAGSILGSALGAPASDQRSTSPDS